MLTAVRPSTPIASRLASPTPKHYEQSAFRYGKSKSDAHYRPCLPTRQRAFQEALDRVMVGRTTLVIAHRLSTIR